MYNPSCPSEIFYDCVLHLLYFLDAAFKGSTGAMADGPSIKELFGSDSEEEEEQVDDQVCI